MLQASNNEGESDVGWCCRLRPAVLVGATLAMVLVLCAIAIIEMIVPGAWDGWLPIQVDARMSPSVQTCLERMRPFLSTPFNPELNEVCETPSTLGLDTCFASDVLVFWDEPTQRYNAMMNVSWTRSESQSNYQYRSDESDLEHDQVVQLPTVKTVMRWYDINVVHVPIAFPPMSDSRRTTSNASIVRAFGGELARCIQHAVAG